MMCVCGVSFGIGSHPASTTKSGKYCPCHGSTRTYWSNACGSSTFESLTLELHAINASGRVCASSTSF